MGFEPVARHRSREVMLYRQGTMNLIVNAHDAKEATPEIKAIALGCATPGRPGRTRSRSGPGRCRRAPRRWSSTSRSPRVGDSLLYFVDRYQDFSIYDVDFVYEKNAERNPPALAGLHYFGVVQSIYGDRTRDWVDFYRNLFGFSVLPEGKYFGVLPKGTLLESPCHKFYLQLIEPPPGSEDIHWEEALVRVGLGAPDVPAATRALQSRGVVFVDRGPVQPSEKARSRRSILGGVPSSSSSAIWP